MKKYIAPEFEDIRYTADECLTASQADESYNAAGNYEDLPSLENLG